MRVAGQIRGDRHSPVVGTHFGRPGGFLPGSAEDLWQRRFGRFVVSAAGCHVEFGYSSTWRRREFVESLDALTLDHGGRVYLAKDATLTAERFALMYPKLDVFRETLSRYDPECLFAPDLARRLKIRPNPS